MILQLLMFSTRGAPLKGLASERANFRHAQNFSGELDRSAAESPVGDAPENRLYAWRQFSFDLVHLGDENSNHRSSFETHDSCTAQ
jgi:hypothetical protein